MSTLLHCCMLCKWKHIRHANRHSTASSRWKETYPSPFVFFFLYSLYQTHTECPLSYVAKKNIENKNQSRFKDPPVRHIVSQPSVCPLSSSFIIYKLAMHFSLLHASSPATLSLRNTLYSLFLKILEYTGRVAQCVWMCV